MCVEGIFLDTACGQTLVRKGLVPKGKLLSETVELRCVHGDKVSYPLAMKRWEEEEKEARQVGERLAGVRVNPVEVEELAVTPGEVAELNLTDEMFQGEDEESVVIPGKVAK